jgi:O-antigen/teichoic acid export membrane protein
VWRGEQNLWVEGVLLVSARLLTATIGIAGLLLGGKLITLSLITFLTVGGVAIAGIFHLYQTNWLTRQSKIHNLKSNILYAALPLGIAIFLSIAYTRVAVILLQWRLDEVAVGQFSAAFRLAEPMQILPASLIAAIFPAYTQALHQNPARATQMSRTTSLLLGAIGVGLALFFWFGASTLIPLLYGDGYGESIRVLRWLGLSLPPIFVNNSLTHYLIARNQQKVISLFTGSMLLLHVGISWWLMPTLGAIAPAISLTIAEWFLFGGCIYWLWRN